MRNATPMVAASSREVRGCEKDAFRGTLVVRHSAGWPAEHRYILGVLVEERLGLRCETEAVPELEWVEIRCPEIGPRGRVLRVGANFLLRPVEQQLSAAAMPVLPLSGWDPALMFRGWQFGRLPVIYPARCMPLAECRNGGDVFLPVDLFGGAFFLLSRYEELVVNERDHHGRFSARSSVAAKAGFIFRPLVDEYAELLRWAVEACFPGIRCRRPQPRIRLTHDVDHAFQFLGRTWTQMALSAAKTLWRKPDAREAWRLLRTAVRAGLGKVAAADPYNTYDGLMHASEQLGTPAEFYFMTGVTNRRYDEFYDLAQPALQDVLHRIYRRGHVIGLHSSYDSFRSESRLRQEMDALRCGAERSGIPLDVVGGRQHYLRWDHPLSWRCREAAGLAYDATLGFPDQVGFRCGTAHDFPAFDLEQSKQLQLRERPLIAMDVTLTDYMGLSPDEVTATLERLWSAVRRVGGTFEVLIHNCNPMALWLTERLMQLRS